MTDADNDEVRCRWATGYDECGGICGSMPHARMYHVSSRTLFALRGARGWGKGGVWTDDEFSGGCLFPNSVSNQQLLFHE